MTVNETHVFSPALVNEVRAGFNRISITFIPQTLVDTARSASTSDRRRTPIALPAITITGPGLIFGGPAGFPSGREVTTFAVGDTATYLHGNHIIKFGGEVRRVKHYGFNEDPGRFTYPSVAAFQQGFGSAFSITLGTQAFNALRQRDRRIRAGFDFARLQPQARSRPAVRLSAVADGSRTTSWSTFDPATVSLAADQRAGGFRR